MMPASNNQIVITPKYLSPLINIVTIVFLALTALCVGGRLFTKLATHARIDAADVAILVAFVRLNFQAELP